MKRLFLADMDDGPAPFQVRQLFQRLLGWLLSLPRMPSVVTDAMTEFNHMRTLAELKDLEERKDHLRKEISAARRELMRLSGKEAMTRHKLRTM